MTRWSDERLKEAIERTEAALALLQQIGGDTEAARRDEPHATTA